MSTALLVRAAAAHERGMWQLDLAVSGTRIDAHAIFAAQDRVDPAHFFDEQLELSVDGSPCAAHLDRAEPVGQDLEAWATIRCTETPGHVTATLYDLRPEERVVASLHTADQLSQAVLTPEKRQISLVVPRSASARPARTWTAALALFVTLIIVTVWVRRRSSSHRTPGRSAPP
jgi:hypothetical protein